MSGLAARIVAALLGASLALPAFAQNINSPFGAAPAFQLPGSKARIAVPTLASPMLGGAPLRDGIDPPETTEGDAAFGAFQRGYFATAMAEAMKRLKRDPKDGAAMALMGELYAQGLAVPKNPAESAKWDRLGSEQGNREATFSYAMALLTGSGVPKDRKAAQALFEKAAAKGHAGALYNLGVMAIQGTTKGHDFSLGAVFFQRAAEAGDVDALFALATLYQAGTGVPQDLRKAADLMREAADDKHVGAEVEYGIMLFNGKGVDKDEAGAARYFLAAAYQGNPIAEDRLARLYAAGRGVAKDTVEAGRWHILARAAGIPDAWLDDQLAALTPADKGKVEDLVRRQLGDN